MGWVVLCKMYGFHIWLCFSHLIVKIHLSVLVFPKKGCNTEIMGFMKIYTTLHIWITIMYKLSVSISFSTTLNIQKRLSLLYSIIESSVIVFKCNHLRYALLRRISNLFNTINNSLQTLLSIYINLWFLHLNSKW